MPTDNTKEKEVHKLIIIGSGPAGLTAGVYASRADLSPILFQGDKPGGQLMSTTLVENWPGNISIQGPELMIQMQEHAKHYGTKLISETITSVDFSSIPFKVTSSRQRDYYAQAIIIATGATPKRLQVPGEDKYWGKGITTCAVCDGAFYKDKKVVVIGGGDTSMESALFLKKFTKDITIIQNKDELTASAAMKDRVLNDDTFNIIYSSTISEFHGDDTLNAVTVKNLDSGDTQKMNIAGAFIAIGMDPNTQSFKGSIELDDWGYIKLHDETKTSVEGVFAAGDAHDYRYRQAVTAAGSGCMAALDAERYLAEQD